MISYIRLKNFKSFSDIMFDLRAARGKPKKVAFIYGENGSGKSNLLLSTIFLFQTFETIKNQLAQPKISTNLEKLFEGSPSEVKEKILHEILKGKNDSLEDIIKRYWMIDNEDPMEIEIGFHCKGKPGYYRVRCSKEKVVEETLYFVVSERSGILFSIDAQNVNLSPKVFLDTKYRRELYEAIDKYWGKHTFMAILYGELFSKNKEYVQNRVSPRLIDFLEMMRKISTLHKANHQETGRIAIPIESLQHLDEGMTKSNKDKELLATQKFLNDYFTQLYSDIKRAFYRFEKGSDGYYYELCFEKICGNKKRVIPVSQESTGTKKLLDLMPLFFTCTLDNTVFVDEVDSGIHDLLMKDVLEILQDAISETEEAQFIATTHNTLLLDSLKPENVYILKSDIYGQKELSCVTEYQFRTHKNNSVRHKYLQGLYQGVPEIGFIDFRSLVRETLQEALDQGSTRQKEG